MGLRVWGLMVSCFWGFCVSRFGLYGFPARGFMVLRAFRASCFGALGCDGSGLALSLGPGPDHNIAPAALIAMKD